MKRPSSSTLEKLNPLDAFRVLERFITENEEMIAKSTDARTQRNARRPIKAAKLVMEGGVA